MPSVVFASPQGKEKTCSEQLKLETILGNNSLAHQRLHYKLL